MQIQNGSFQELLFFKKEIVKYLSNKKFSTKSITLVKTLKLIDKEILRRKSGKVSKTLECSFQILGSSDCSLGESTVSYGCPGDANDSGNDCRKMIKLPGFLNDSKDETSGLLAKKRGLSEFVEESPVLISRVTTFLSCGGSRVTSVAGADAYFFRENCNKAIIDFNLGLMEARDDSIYTSDLEDSASEFSCENISLSKMSSHKSSHCSLSSHESSTFSLRGKDTDNDKDSNLGGFKHKSLESKDSKDHSCSETSNISRSTHDSYNYCNSCNSCNTCKRSTFLPRKEASLFRSEPFLSFLGHYDCEKRIIDSAELDKFFN